MQMLTQDRRLTEIQEFVDARYAAQAGVLAGTNDANCDLSTVGNEHG